MGRTGNRMGRRLTGVWVTGLAVALSLGGCFSGGQSEWHEENEESPYQQLKEGLEDYEESQDDFYKALEQDRQAYVAQRAGELGLSLDDPNIQRLMEPVDWTTYRSQASAEDTTLTQLAPSAPQEASQAALPAPDASMWWRESLTDEGKALYDQWYPFLRDGYQQLHVDMGYIGHEQLFTDVWEAIQCDHPELFWISLRGYDWTVHYYDDPSLGSEISHGFACPVEDIPRLRDEIDASIARFRGFVGNDTEPSHVATRAAIWLSNRLTYEQNPQDQCVLSSLLSDKTVCAGYGMAYRMLLSAYGIPCISVVGAVDTGSGIADGESHLWNAVWIDGEWHCVDVTFIDQDTGAGGYDWKYLMFSTEDYETRTIDGPANAVPTTASVAMTRWARDNAGALEQECMAWL